MQQCRRAYGRVEVKGFTKTTRCFSSQPINSFLTRRRDLPTISGRGPHPVLPCALARLFSSATCPSSCSRRLSKEGSFGNISTHKRSRFSAQIRHAHSGGRDLSATEDRPVPKAEPKPLQDGAPEERQTEDSSSATQAAFVAEASKQTSDRAPFPVVLEKLSQDLQKLSRKSHQVKTQAASISEVAPPESPSLPPPSLSLPRPPQPLPPGTGPEPVPVPSGSPSIISLTLLRIRDSASTLMLIFYYTPRRLIRRVTSFPRRTAMYFRYVVKARIQRRFTRRIYRPLKSLFTVKSSRVTTVKPQQSLNQSSTSSKPHRSRWNFIRLFLDMISSIRARFFSSPLPPPQSKVPSVAPKEVKEMHRPESRKPGPKTIARREALRLLRSLDILASHSQPYHENGSAKAGSKMGDVGKEAALAVHGNGGSKGLQPTGTITSSGAEARSHRDLSIAEDSYVALYPELSAPEMGSEFDELDSVSLLRPLKTEDNELSKEAWHRVRNCMVTLDQLMASVRNLKLPNDLKSSSSIPQTVSALHAIVAHVRLQGLDAVVRHSMFQAMMGRIEHIAAAAAKHGPSSLKSSLFPGIWQLLRRDEAVIKKMIGLHPLFGRRSFMPQALVRDKFAERRKVDPSLDKALVAAESTPSQLPFRGRTFGEFTSQDVFIDPIPRKDTDPPIPRLVHQLDRVLFNPAPYMLQDYKTRVYNFNPYLQNIPSIREFDFDKVAPFTPSSEHSELQALARQRGKSFVGSTSSLTALLSHMYFVISRMKWVNTTQLSGNFTEMLRNFTPAATMPAGVIIHYKDGVYSTDSDNLVKNSEADDRVNILTKMGTMLEYFLTCSPEIFARLNRDHNSGILDIARQGAYQYTETKEFIMRSQLDCYDPRLPGTGVFDIKTRAVVAIRLDLENFEENSSYLIRSMTGQYSSFERELYDLMRSALLKYNFQARIGAMTGIFIAYHNTSQIQGFQYMSLAEMDERLFGRARRGDTIFSMCVGLMERVMKVILEIYPEQSIRVLFETTPNGSVMNVYIELLEWRGAGPRPVHELAVSTRVYTDGKYDATPDFDSPNWTVKYLITKYPPSLWTRRHFNLARTKALSIGLPPLDHSASPDFDATDPPTRSSVAATTRRTSRSRGIVPHLRRLARADRIYLEKLKQKTAGSQMLH